MRPIDADVLVQMYEELKDRYKDGICFEVLDSIIKDINNTPTIEPNGDLISRAEAIEAVVCHIWHTPAETRKMFNCENYVRDVVEEALNKLPSADHDGCDGCQYEYYSDEDVPCSICKQNYIDRYKPREKLTSAELALVRRLINKFEEEHSKAHAESSGLKEPAVWVKAIKVLEDEIEEG